MSYTDWVAHYGTIYDKSIEGFKLGHPLPTPSSVCQDALGDAVGSILADNSCPIGAWLEYIGLLFRMDIPNIGCAGMTTTPRMASYNMLQCMSIPPDSFLWKDGNEVVNTALNMNGQPVNFSIPACFSLENGSGEWVVHPKGPLTIGKNGEQGPVPLPADP